MSDIAGNDFVTRDQIRQLKSTIEAQKAQLDEVGHLDDSDELYTSFSWEDGGFVEIACGADRGFIHIVAEGLSDEDFSTVEKEIKRPIGGSTPATLDFVHRTPTTVRYGITY